jgi:hypothetical protein
MRIPLTLVALCLCLSALAWGAATAAAEDSPAPQTDLGSWQQHLRNHAITSSTGQGDILGAYLRQPNGADAGEAKGPPSDFALFNRFTRLAGMFMGRVSPLSAGSMKLCFKLDIH